MCSLVQISCLGRSQPNWQALSLRSPGVALAGSFHYFLAHSSFRASTLSMGAWYTVAWSRNDLMLTSSCPSACIAS